MEIIKERVVNMDQKLSEGGLLNKVGKLRCLLGSRFINKFKLLNLLICPYYFTLRIFF